MSAPSINDWVTDIQRYWIIGNGQPNLAFDAVVSESHSSLLDVTEEPLETGETIADHAVMKPLRLELECWVGDFSLHQDEAASGPFASTARRSVVAFEILQNLQASAVPFSVQSGLRLYNNMVIEELSVLQDKDSASVLAFHVTLREVLIVSTQTTTYPPRKPGKPARQAAPRKDGGDKSAEGPKSADQVTSALASITGVGAKGPTGAPLDLKALGAQIFGISTGGGE